MNSKKTNRLVIILNILAIISVYVLMISNDYLLKGIMTGGNKGKSVFNSFIIDTLMNNLQIIMTIVFCGIGTLNIICSIQNKQNKKLFLGQLAFGICELCNAICIVLALKQYIFIEWANKIINVIELILIIVQLIFVHFQDKNIIESKQRKIANIILYYILQLILVISFLGLILISLIITRINNSMWEKELYDLYNNIENLQGAKNDELYIPVENDYKYGFINSKGQEKIQCQYDRVSYFCKLEINNNLYYIALAKKDDKFYIISKNNDCIMISGNLDKYLQNMYDNWSEESIKQLNIDENYRNGYLTSFNLFFSGIMKDKGELIPQVIEKESKNINLNEQDSKYYYKDKNYSMIIELIYNEGEDTKHKVTITKSNGKKETSIIYLTDFDKDTATIETMSNGYIRFEDEENKRNGWFDDNGNKTTVSNKYIIDDIKDNKVILQADNTNDDSKEDLELYFIILDMTGKKLLQTTALDVYENMYLVKLDNKKMVLMDKDLKVISNEYDKINSTMNMDVYAQYSSYY